MAHDSYKTAPECELTCPCRTASRETPDADRIYQMDGAVRASSLTEGVPGSLDMVAQFDAMVAARRAGGVGSATADTTRASTLESETAPTVPPVSPPPKRKSKGPRCIENIPTDGRKVAHQCRNRAKYGDYCVLHSRTTPDESLESFPAALIEPAADPFQW